MMNKKLWYGLAAIGLFRVCMVAGFLYDVPPLMHEGWKFHQGGDQILYFSIARSLVALNPLASKYSMGFPLLLVPFIIVFNPASWLDLIKPVLTFHVILSVLFVFVIGFIAWMVSKNVFTVIASATLWVLHPYLMYASFALHSQAATVRSSYVSHAMWFPILSDASSTFFVLLGILLYFWSEDKQRYVYGAGCMIGVAGLIRSPNLLAGVILSATYLLRKEYVKTIKFCGCMLLLFTPQFLYNAYFNASPFVFGYTETSEGRTVLFSVHYLISYGAFLMDKYPAIFVALLIGTIIVPIYLLMHYKRQRHEWSLLILYTYVYTLFYATWWAFNCFPYRFLIPVVPTAIIIITAFFTGILSAVRRKMVSLHTVQQ
jgi:hypothetical protein